ncbi:MAG: hypothetical protein HC804_09710 [Anaerolineae bacterium]|nr:hypothetical protein [Anaerolineae bacterium]
MSDPEPGSKKPARISVWDKLYWKAAYWWHSRVALPHIRPAQWTAVLAALVLVVGLVSITSAYSYTVQQGGYSV